MSDKPLSSGTHDIVTSPDDEERQLRLENLAAEFVERCRLGDQPRISTYKELHPDLADSIEELFPTIARLEGLKDFENSSSSRRAVVGLPRMDQLGDFRILREIGRGGMGIVFEAEQVTLHRRVALKVLGANVAATESQLARFRREAESAARLHHTNIVPIYGTGDDHGVHFYAMQFIDGWSLSDVIDALAESHRSRGASTAADSHTTQSLSDCELPLPADVRLVPGQRAGQAPRVVVSKANGTAGDPVVRKLLEPRAAAKAIADLADAVAYAHSQGVLHRDIKPSNILIDHGGVSWLVDFGLAKHHEHESLTRTGNVVGTVQYMAPEQFSGDFDQRSDIHSLGLTLYELLSLKPAYADSNQATLMRRKVSEPPPPLRSIAPRVPRDLETVVMKACAVDPAHRYITASAFAEDLRRFVNDQPILARRATPVERLWRWARLHRTVAALSSLTLLLLLTLVGVFAVGQHRAQANLDVAIGALDEIMENVSQRGVPRTLNLELEEGTAQINDVGVSTADAELLTSLLTFYDQFAAQNEADFSQETARAQSRIGDIEFRLGHLDRASEAYEKAVVLYRRLNSEQANDETLLLDFVGTLNQLGMVKAGSGDVAAAFEAHESARALLERVEAPSQKVRFEKAQTLMLLATVGWRAGIRELFAASFAAGGPLMDQGPLPFRGGPWGRGGPWWDRRPGEHGGHFGRRPEQQGGHRPPPPPRGEGPPKGHPGDHGKGPPPNPIHKALEDLNEASQILQGLLAEDPRNPDFRLALARCDLNRREFVQAGPWLMVEQQSPASAAKPEEMLRELVAENPTSPKYRFELAEALGSRARFVGELEEADRESHLRESITLAQELTKAYPRVSGYQALEGRAQHDLAQFLKYQDKLDEACGHFDAAMVIQKRLAEENPTSSFFQVAWAQLLLEWSTWQREKGESAEADQSLQEAVDVAERSAPSWGNDHLFRMFLDILHARLEQRKEAQQ